MLSVAVVEVIVNRLVLLPLQIVEAVKVVRVVYHQLVKHRHHRSASLYRAVRPVRNANPMHALRRNPM